MKRYRCRIGLKAVSIFSAVALNVLMFFCLAVQASDPHAAYYSSDNNHIFWFIQISDIHIGTRGSQDEDYLAWIVNEAKSAIEPAFIVASGDLTDSTNGNIFGYPNGPYQAEWDQYKSILANKVDADSYYDIPGNHDAYNDQYFEYYLANSIQGEATSNTQLSWTKVFPFGTYHFLGVNSADNTGDSFSLVWPWGDYAGLDQDELDFINGQLASNSDATLTLVFGHHPVTDTGYSDDTWLYYGAPEFVGSLDFYGASMYGYGHTHRSEEALFAGDDYTGYMAGDGIFYFNVPSLGKSNDWHYSVVAIDCNGISSVTQAKGTWPVVLITAPMDLYLGGAPNPYAYPVPNASTNPIRALVFANTVGTVQYRVDGTGDWHTMNPVAGNAHLWEGVWDASNLSNGYYTIEVQAEAIQPGGTTVRTDAISVSVAGASNTPPMADDQTVTTSEDTAVNITLTATDADSDPLNYAIASSPAKGILSGTAPNLTYTPNPDYNGADSFSFKANDGLADSNGAVVAITVTPVNDAPVAMGDSYSVDQNPDLTVPAPGVLENDTDVDGNALTAALVGGPANGSVILYGDGSFRYTPDTGFTGTDSFTYRADDGEAESNTTTVQITVNVSTVDTVTILTASYNPKPKRLLVEATSSAQPDAALTVEGYGDMTYSAIDGKYVYNEKMSPEPSFVTVVSSKGGSDTYNLSGGTNSPPVADDQHVTFLVNTTDNSITLTATDSDSDTLNFTVVTLPSHGTLSGIAPDLTYTPYEGYVGSDSFAFQANDGQADSNIATVSITVTNTSTDEVTIIVAQYRAKAKQLLVEATSSAQPAAVLTLEDYGEMTFSTAEGKYIYQSKVAQAPGEMVTVRSTLGGSHTAPVTVK